MTIGFFHVDTHTEASAQNHLCAKALLKSARDKMPGVEVVQFTDLKTRAVKDVDTVRRKPSEPMALLRMRHQAGVEGEWVFVDTDVVFQQKVREVFKSEFQIGITSRAWSHLKPAGGFSSRMPYNTGVVFSRCPRFFAEAYTRLKHLEPDKQQWMGDQEVIGDMIGEEPCRYDVRILSGSKYNFPPVLEDPTATYEQSLAQARIVHYKGPTRKRLLLERIRRGLWTSR